LIILVRVSPEALDPLWQDTRLAIIAHCRTLAQQSLNKTPAVIDYRAVHNELAAAERESEDQREEQELAAVAAQVQEAAQEAVRSGLRAVEAEVASLLADKRNELSKKLLSLDKDFNDLAQLTTQGKVLRSLCRNQCQLPSAKSLAAEVLKSGQCQQKPVRVPSGTVWGH
jgi:hypothetical protein